MAATPPNVGQVYRDHAQFVWRAARGLGCPEEAAEDVVHEVFIVVHRRLADYDPARSMRTWLFGITRNVVLHLKRGMARRFRRIEALAPPAAPADPEQQLAGTRAVELVDRFLADLDADKRLVFQLGSIEGMTAPEIADALGIKLNTVYSRHRAARLRFEAWVAQQRGEEGVRESG